MRPFLAESRGYRPANAVRGACDDGDFILKSHQE